MIIDRLRLPRERPEPSELDEPDAVERESPRSLVDPETLVWGVVGGLIATVVMTAYRLPVARSLPPTADFWATFVGSGDPEEYPLLGLLLHLLYGAGGGAAFAVLYDLVPQPESPTPEGRATAWGLVYGLALSLFGERVLLETLLGQHLADDERLVFHVSHAIYGLTLGTWVGSRGEDE